MVLWKMYKIYSITQRATEGFFFPLIMCIDSKFDIDVMHHVQYGWIQTEVDLKPIVQIWGNLSEQNSSLLIV